MAITPNRWAVREAAEATFYNTATGDAIVTLQTLKMTEVQTTGETVYARGGKGNAKIQGFSSNREARVTIQDAIFDNLALGMLTGNDIVEGSQSVSKFYRATLDALGSFEVPAEMGTIDSVISIHALDYDGITPLAPLVVTTDYTITGNEIDIVSGTLGDKYVVYFQTTTQPTSKTVTVTADKFGGTFKLVVDVTVRDEFTGHDFYGQFVAERAKIEDDFSFNFSPDGDPSVLDIPIEILKDPMSKDMWKLIIF